MEIDPSSFEPKRHMTTLKALIGVTASLVGIMTVAVGIKALVSSQDVTKPIASAPVTASAGSQNRGTSAPSLADQRTTSTTGTTTSPAVAGTQNWSNATLGSVLS